jgi:hypothetical protein
MPIGAFAMGRTRNEHGSYLVTDVTGLFGPAVAGPGIGIRPAIVGAPPVNAPKTPKSGDRVIHAKDLRSKRVSLNHSMAHAVTTQPHPSERDVERPGRSPV